MKNDGNSSTVWRSWSTGFLTNEIRATVEQMRQWPKVEQVVTLPDIHLAGKTCNGAVVATRDVIYPAAIGADIGCGMSAIPLKTAVDIFADEDLRHAILHAWRGGIAILKNARSDATPPNPSALSTPALQHTAERDGRYQLGTLGRGNHFLELQIDEEGAYWLLVHSGSRAMGQAVTAFHESQGIKLSRDLVFLDTQTEQGQAYLNDLAWCRKYASANRRAILERAAELLADSIPIEANFSAAMETDHNHLEVHGDLLVHRKGAQGFPKGGWGIVPGSMASATYHVEGRGCEEALDSCSHGAGRQLTRTQATQTLALRDVRRSLAEVTFEDSQLARIVDEAPATYRDIEAVMRAQRDLVKRTRKLQPLLTLKGGR